MAKKRKSDNEGFDRPRPKMGRATVPPEMNDPQQRLEWGLPKSETGIGPYMVELNLFYHAGLQEAATQFEILYQQVIKDEARKPVLISKTYYKCEMSVKEWRELVSIDESQEDRRQRVIYRIWPDYPVKPLMDRSVSTIKADAAVRSYDATGEGIVWAVIDSGIASTHIHFGNQTSNHEFNTLLDPEVATLHRDFTVPGEPIESALVDDFGHGTHVAGIIAGGLGSELVYGTDYQVYAKEYKSDDSGKKIDERLKERKVSKSSRLRGVSPQCKLVSLKVLGTNGAGRASDVMRALQYIREGINGDPKLLRVHGVNLSIGYEFDAEMFACGQSPLCVEVDRLVKSGVVVVVAAGNTGYGTIMTNQRPTKVGLSNTINDPGNAALAITVGATHRDSPHIYGVSYFSSKGPTGDGRLKPDLVAPGERITSCAAGRLLAGNGGKVPDSIPAYIDDTGTSMAAPHVSGAIAAFLSIRREFINRPEEVKRIFLETGTPLGREKYFEGHGLLDLMRAIQAV